MNEIEPTILEDDVEELFRSRSAESREQLVRSFYPLAEYLARRFAGRGEPLDDLTQVASIGLLKAVDRFDPDRGVQFTTFATPTIVGELKRYLRDKGWALRIPRRMKENGLRVRQVIADVTQELGRSPTVNEISERVGLDEEEVLEAMDAIHAYSVDSLDAPVDDERTGAVSERTLADVDENLELVEGWADVAPILRELPGRERRVLFLRFGRGLTQSEIAQQLGISQMHVSRLLARTIEAIRERLDEAQGEP